MALSSHEETRQIFLTTLRIIKININSHPYAAEYETIESLLPYLFINLIS